MASTKISHVYVGVHNFVDTSALSGLLEYESSRM